MTIEEQFDTIVNVRVREGTENPFRSPSPVRLEVLGRWSLSHDSREKTRRGGVGSTSGHYSGEGSIPFPESLFLNYYFVTIA